jgi:type I restriction enzyme M protein
LPGYSRIVPMTEIADPKNDYNLNIPRYIDTQDAEDIQDITAHLQGGIPANDVEALHNYWQVYPKLKDHLFTELRPGYLKLNVSVSEIKKHVFEHPEFVSFNVKLQNIFDSWIKEQREIWRNLQPGIHPKEVLEGMSESLLQKFADNPLVDKYDAYQQMMQYWNEAMQDDMYSIALDGWTAGNEWERTIIKGKKGKDGKAGKDKVIEGLDGIVGRMISPDLLIKVYFKEQWDNIIAFEAEIEALKTQLEESEQENELESTVFSELDKVNLTTVKMLLKQRKKDKAPKEEITVIENYINLNEAIKNIASLIKIAKNTIEKSVIDLYPELSEQEIKAVVIHEKWEFQLQTALHQLQDKISQNLAQRIKELAARYENTLPELEMVALDYEAKVKQHLKEMGFVWN